MKQPDELRREYLKRYWCAATMFHLSPTRSRQTIVVPTLGAVINGTTGLLQERAKAVLREVLDHERTCETAGDG